MSDRDERAEIAGEIRDETDRAWLFHDGARNAWLPRSLCEWDADTKTMDLPLWLAKKRGLI